MISLASSSRISFPACNDVSGDLAHSNHPSGVAKTPTAASTSASATIPSGWPRVPDDAKGVVIDACDPRSALRLSQTNVHHHELVMSLKHKELAETKRMLDQLRQQNILLQAAQQSCHERLTEIGSEGGHMSGLTFPPPYEAESNHIQMQLTRDWFRMVGEFNRIRNTREDLNRRSQPL